VLIDFFTTSTKNLLDYSAKAGISHLLALSVVGTQRLGESSYFRAKIIQENLISAGKLPYTIIEATQFFDFMKGLADFSTQGDKVHMAPVFFQPMTPDDVAKAVERIALSSPANGTVEIAGPEKLRLDEVIRRVLQANGDPREVIADPSALYFGAHVTANSLLPEPGATLSGTSFEQWLAAIKTQKAVAING
jgi:uncharacterized protein YbjT (DUF2867 family)